VVVSEHDDRRGRAGRGYLPGFCSICWRLCAASHSLVSDVAGASCGLCSQRARSGGQVAVTYLGCVTHVLSIVIVNDGGSGRLSTVGGWR